MCLVSMMSSRTDVTMHPLIELLMCVVQKVMWNRKI